MVCITFKITGTKQRGWKVEQDELLRAAPGLTIYENSSSVMPWNKFTFSKGL